MYIKPCFSKSNHKIQISFKIKFTRITHTHTHEKNYSHSKEVGTEQEGEGGGRDGFSLRAGNEISRSLGVEMAMPEAVERSVKIPNIHVA